MDSRLSVRVPRWFLPKLQSKAQYEGVAVATIVKRLVWAWYRGELSIVGLEDLPSKEPDDS